MPLSEMPNAQEAVQVSRTHGTHGSYASSYGARPWAEVDYLILKASTYECLNSKSEYIRECKKWFLSLSLEETLRFIMRDVLDLDNFTWSGKPTSLTLTEDFIYDSFRQASYHLYMDNDQTYTNEQNKRYAKRNYSCMVDADNFIRLAHPSLALTSKILYIRECKKWYINNPQ